MILVAGSTGFVGQRVVRRLAGQGRRVRALVRPGADAGKVDAIRAEGVTFVEGDLKDPPSLRVACDGVSTVISTASATISRGAGDTIDTVDRDGQLALVDAARATTIPTHVGPVATVDLLYNPHLDYLERWRSRGILGFEMEAAALFYLASRASASGADVRAACILTVSDVLSETETTEATYLPLAELERATERMINAALEGALAAAS